MCVNTGDSNKAKHSIYVGCVILMADLKFKSLKFATAIEMNRNANS